MDGPLTASDAPCGFWGCIDSSVDWCETNYVVLSFVAEFANTISSFVITVTAAAGWYLAQRGHVVARQTEIAVVYGAVAIVGLGSAAFHATLRHYPQYLDEVPMLMAAGAFCYVLVKQNDPNRNLFAAVALTAIFGVAIVSYVMLDEFKLFFGAYFFSVSFMVFYPPLATSCFSRRDTDDAGIEVDLAAARRHYYLAAVFFFLGFGFWLWEHFRCLEADGEDGFRPREHRGWEMKYLPAHALWHLNAGIGCTYFAGFLVCYRSFQLKISTRAAYACSCWLRPSDDVPCKKENNLSDIEEDAALVVVDNASHEIV
ncbi:Alkaline ceramidase YPC1 [Diplonema papillatum]|nr:Alkaline ceramidase YPC1 [Diplonema papillatum]